MVFQTGEELQMRRRCTVLLLLAAVVLMPSIAFADAQVTNFRCVMQYCHDRFFALAGVTFYDPLTADWTLTGGVGILDANEFELISLILANPSAPNHDAIHTAFTHNAATARVAIGTTLINTTTSKATTGPTARQPIPGTSPQAYYAADALMGCYLTMGEWGTYDETMCSFRNDSVFGAGVTWPKNSTDVPPKAKAGLQEYLRANYDLSQAGNVGMCGDADADGAKNCNEYWAASPNSYANAIVYSANPAVAMLWNAWACIDEENTSVKFSYNPTTQRVYVKSAGEVSYADALTYTVGWPGGTSIPVRLAEIHNQAEQDYVYSVARPDDAFIGCTDVAKDGPGHVAPNKEDWYWLSDPTQSVMTYEFWRSPPNAGADRNEPNGVNHAEDVAHIRGGDGLWNDVNTGSTGKFAVFESTGTWPDVNPANGAPDAFEDLNNDLIPDGLGVPKPVANFSVDVDLGDMPLEVQFTDLSEPNGEPITSWAWTFGDGGTSTLQNPTHTYMATSQPFSQYTVSLTVTNANGTSTKTVANMIKVNYVCVFDGELTFQGELFALALLAEEPLSDELKALLQYFGQTSWSLFDWEGLEADFPPNPPTVIPGDGLPDAAQIALIEYVACNTMLDANAVTYAGMVTNKALFLEDVAALAALEPDFGALAFFGDLFAGLIGSSEEMRDTVNALIYALTSGYTGLPNYADYVVFGLDKEGPLFGADGDVDGDGKTNLEEYEAVMAAGGDIDTFIDAATDPYNFWDGNPDLPVAGILGLGLLAGTMLAGAALAIRKK
jgi:PKD repeat protein